MIPQLSEAIWQMSFLQIRDTLQELEFSRISKSLFFYSPSFAYYENGQYALPAKSFPTISITAEQCTLNCRHCNRIVLEGMYPATTPDALFELCTKLRQNHAQGCLISGGCTREGSVPLRQFISTIARIKRELDLTVFVHTGIIGKVTALALQRAEVDAALIDVIGSNETVREICHMDADVHQYEKSLQALEQSRLPFIPHIITGLHYGELRGERTALEMIARHEPSAVVVIAFMPIRGSEMANVKAPQPEDIARVVLASRISIPDKPIVLGCMRPKGKEREDSDILAIKAGVNAIAFPAKGAIRYAKEHAYKTMFSPFCCAKIYSDAIQDRMS